MSIDSMYILYMPYMPTLGWWCQGGRHIYGSPMESMGVVNLIILVCFVPKKPPGALAPLGRQALPPRRCPDLLGARLPSAAAFTVQCEDAGVALPEWGEEVPEEGGGRDFWAAQAPAKIRKSGFQKALVILFQWFVHLRRLRRAYALHCTAAIRFN